MPHSYRPLSLTPSAICFVLALADDAPDTEVFLSFDVDVDVPAFGNLRLVGKGVWQPKQACWSD